MPPRPRANRPQPSAQRGYTRLEHRLALLAWLHRQLGYEKTTDLLVDMKPADEGFDHEGRSHIYARLASQSERLQGVTTDDLQRYDDNIRRHLVCMNTNPGRSEPITLRYFQYLAALYTEIYLDRYCGNRNGLLDSLNKFVSWHNANCSPDERYAQFVTADLDKLAFWMATGSGKTLLLHLNYRQFLHYNRNPLDNILLITPNEGLTKQHIEELQASGIPAERFDSNARVGSLGGTQMVKAIEITKLVEEKKGKGARVPVEAFEGNNLIFVDEGHKGASSEAQRWMGVRKSLGKTGFTFEYSATFGQALAAARDEDLLTEYGKAIAFDYSYRHFYGDGYGKNFNILNLQQESDAEQTDILLLANLLSFYEQQLVFTEQEPTLQPYNFERPLWMFVCNRVTGKDAHSDILTVAKFLHRVLSKPDWAKDSIKRLLNGTSGFTTEAQRDIFDNRFGYLRHRETDSESIYQDALRKVLHADVSSGLELSDLRRCDGELGLKAAGAESYFGVIYIGDTAKFNQLAMAGGSGIEFTEDALEGSLFSGINEPDSTVEVLAGSRKFIEGWNSWRVSNMGLLHMGGSEGSQIIQLFGRGVRLKGRGMSLKRSLPQLGERHPDYIRSLETLNIFALRANYMERFREYLEEEGINTQEPIELPPLFIRPNHDFLNKGLVIPRLDDGQSFAEQETVLLQHDGSTRQVSVTASAKAQQITSGGQGLIDASAASWSGWPIPSASLDLVDWDQAYLALLEHKESKGFSNLLIRPSLMRPILESKPEAYYLEAEQSVIEPENQENRHRLQEVVTSILRKYAESLYRHRQAQWESNHMTYRQLNVCDPNFQFNISEGDTIGKYIVKIPRDNPASAQQIEQLIEDCNALYRQDQGALPRIHFDHHLYQPLLVEDNGVTSSPPGLQKSEHEFVEDLRNYCKGTASSLPSNAELFLLRNLTRGKGVGFFESKGFYPDFILWIKTGNAQRIVFVEPHGMHDADAYEYDEKAKLHAELPEIARQIAIRSGNTEVSLDSFIVSTTHYERLRQRYGNGEWTQDDFADKHILFREGNGDYGYLERILQG